MNEEIHPAIRRLATICRCNNIKYGTIERSIKAGAANIEQIARATTATTGLCGGSCTPRVIEMLDDLVVPATEPETPKAGDDDAWWIRKS